MTLTTLARGNGAKTFERYLVSALLILGLVISSFAGILVAYIALAIALMAAAHLAGQQTRKAWTLDTMGILFALGFALLTLSFAISATEWPDLRHALNFLAFLLYVPLASILARRASPHAARIVGWLALAGAILGAVYSIGEVVLTGAERAGSFRLVTDPIRLANTTLLLGFLALIGFRQQAGHWRYLLFTGPVFGLAAIIACGARSAMVAFGVILFWAAFSMIRSWRVRALVGLLLAGILAAIIFGGVLQSERLDSLVLSLQQMLTGQTVTDRSVDIRLALYRAAVEAFWQAPLFGHGWSGMMQAIAPLLPEMYADQAGLPHLHNELLNFALSTGLVGVLVFLTLIAAPVVIAIRSTPDSQKQARIFGCSLLALGYVVMGLADTMLSYETHTALFVIWSAILLTFCRDAPQRSVRSGNAAKA